MKKLVGVLLCVEVDGGISHLKEDLRVTCMDGDYKLYKNISAYVGLGLYGVGLPLFVVFFLWRNREGIKSNDARQEGSASSNVAF